MQVTLEGEQYNLILYNLGCVYLAQVECLETRETIARGLADRPEQSKQSALAKAEHWLSQQRVNDPDLMVGG